jgi:hypothetical protein
VQSKALIRHSWCIGGVSQSHNLELDDASDHEIFEVESGDLVRHLVELVKYSETHLPSRPLSFTFQFGIRSVIKSKAYYCLLHVKGYFKDYVQVVCKGHLSRYL